MRNEGVKLKLPKDYTFIFEILSDRHFEFAQGLGLPMFEVEGRRLIKPVTLIVKDSC